MLDQLLAFDRQLFLTLNQVGIPAFDPLFLLLSSTYTNVLVYLLIALFLTRKKGWKSFLALTLTILLMITFTDQVTNIFKSGFERLRPCYDPLVKDMVRLVKASCGGRYGFFSGHASNSFALATFFFLLVRKKYPSLGILLLLLATAIAYSRVYLGVHFPLDIVCGSIFGIGSGLLFGYGYHRFAQP